MKCPISNLIYYIFGIHISLLGLSVCTKKIQVTSGIFNGIPGEPLHNYFIPCHIRIYSGQHNHCNAQWEPSGLRAFL